MQKSIDKYVGIICERSGCEKNDLLLKNGGYKISRIRNMIFYILHDFGFSNNQIAKYFNRTTRRIWYARANIKYRIDHNIREEVELYERLKKAVIHN